MPLTPPVEREHTHTRVVTCTGHKRSDGLWDIEGRIVDTKPYRFPNRDRGGWIEADEALHDMSIRLTVDADLTVIDAEAIIDASPYHYCKSIDTVAKQLVGLRIAPGWTQKSKAAMGGSLGCTHLTELLGPIATTAFQTMAKERLLQPGPSTRSASSNRKGMKSPFIDTCHAMAADSPVVKLHWPDQFRPKDAS